METTQKLLDIARDRTKTLKKEIIVSKTLYCCICNIFFAYQVIGNTVIKHQHKYPYRYALVLWTPFSNLKYFP